MRLRDWFILFAVTGTAALVFTMWTQYSYERGYAAGSEMAAFDA